MPGTRLLFFSLKLISKSRSKHAPVQAKLQFVEVQQEKCAANLREEETKPVLMLKRMMHVLSLIM